MSFEPEKEENFGFLIEGEWQFDFSCGFYFANCVKFGVFNGGFDGLKRVFFLWHRGLFGLVDVKWDLKANSMPELCNHESKFWTFYLIFLCLIWNFKWVSFVVSNSCPSLTFCSFIEILQGFAFQSTILFSTDSIWDLLGDLLLERYFLLQKYKISPLNLRGDDKI